MGNRFMWDKIMLDGTLSPLRNGDYHPSYPLSFLKDIWVDYPYRTKYGANSGWGSWYIENNKKYIDFDEGGGELNAVLTTGWYDATSLCTEIETQLETVGSDLYTVTYSDNSNKFNIKNDSGTFSLLWNTGTNSANSVGDDIGFDTSADDTGANDYTSDYVRIHNRGGFIVESGDGSSIAMKGCVLLGLNLTSSYQTLALWRYSGAWYKVGDFVYDINTNRAHLFFSEVSGTKWKVIIKDWQNSDGYVQVGYPIIGTYVDTSRGYEYGETIKEEDQSKHYRSKKGYLNIQRGYHLKMRGVSYEVLDSDREKLEEVYTAVGKHFPFIFIRDTSNSTTIKDTMEYSFFTSSLDRQRVDEWFSRVTLQWYIEG